MKQKKIPERQCLGCGAHKPKQELLRVVRGPDGTVTLDFTGKKPGRGAYICPDPACFKKARRGGRIGHALCCEIPDAVYDALEAELANHEK